MAQQVNVTTRVNRANIRRDTEEGRPHLVVSSYTLPANVVMNGVLYPQGEIDKHYAKLEGTLAPFGHPTQGGKFISATTPLAINTCHVGAFNRNVAKVGNRIHVEKWIDIEFANNTANGKRLIERLEAIERGDEVDPIHTSVAVFIEQMAANEEQKKAGAQFVARIVDMDHDAILMDSVGAATPAQGVGMMVNADAVLAQNASLIDGGAMATSYRARERALEEAARAREPAGSDTMVWVVDFSDTHVIISREGVTEQYEYAEENGKLVLGQTGVPVQRKESWTSQLVSNLKKYFQPVAATPSTKEGDMPITPEESAAVAKQTAELLAVNLKEALAPITSAITALQEGQTKVTEQLTANARSEETAKRAIVAAKHGEIVANGLSGEALDAMVKSCGTAAPLAGNSAAPGADDANKDDPSLIPA